MPVTLDTSNLLNYFPGVTDKLPAFLFHEDATKLLPKIDVYNPYYFKSQQSDTLLVTLGDSWTWAQECSGRSDLSDFYLPDWVINNRVLLNINSDRISHAYGNIVSDAISSDWLNLGVPGWGNFQIAELVEYLTKIIPQLEYKKIIVVCTFTEVGRWFNTSDDIDIDHSRLMLMVEKTNSVETLLKELNRLAIKRITNSLDGFPHVKLLVGTNFVDHIGFNELATDQILPQPWYRLMDISFGFPTYACGAMLLDGFARGMEDGLIPKHLHTLFKTWIVNNIEQSKIQDNILFSSPHFLSNGCKHPQLSGHKIWADYIVKHIC